MGWQYTGRLEQAQDMAGKWRVRVEITHDDGRVESAFLKFHEEPDLSHVAEVASALCVSRDEAAAVVEDLGVLALSSDAPEGKGETPWYAKPFKWLTDRFEWDGAA